MRRWQVIRLWFRSLAAARRADDELARELRFHLDQQTAEYVAAGMSERAARAAAHRTLGNVPDLEEQCRDSRGTAWLGDLRRDVAYACRALARHRGFTLAATLSLALGIGASTAIFSLMDALLFRTLPVQRPNELYFLAHDPGPHLETSANYPLYERYRAAPAFRGVAAYLPSPLWVARPDGIDMAPGQFVSGNYHAVVGAPLVLGRGFSSEPDRAPGASALAVISHRYWQTRFGGAADVIGKTLVVNRRTVSIVGVTAPRFHGLSPDAAADITLPLSFLAREKPAMLESHDTWFDLVIVGRLAAGVTVAQAIASVDMQFQQFLDEPPNRWVKEGARTHFLSATLVPAARGTWSLRQRVAKPLWLLLAMVGVLLLVSCANVGNLLMARSTTRVQEMALRLSVGASRTRLVRQLLTESLVLAAIGGAGGILLAVWGTPAVIALMASGPSALSIDAGVNLSVLLFTIAITLVAGLGFGVAPALRSTRAGIRARLGYGSMAAGAPRQTIGRTLLVGQIALCVVLLAAAGLLTRSLDNLHDFDAGFDRRDVLLVDVNVASLAASPETRQRYYERLLQRLHALPEIRHASLSERSPVDSSSVVRRIYVDGGRRPATAPGARAGNPFVDAVSTNNVSPDYFDALGIQLQRGRRFTAADRLGAIPVAIISRAMARFFFDDANPLGRTFQLGLERESRTIVGVVEDVRQEELWSAELPKMVYLPLAQGAVTLDGGAPEQLTATLRVTTTSAALATIVSREARALDPNVAIPYVRTMEEQVDARLGSIRLMTRLSSTFAMVTLTLACIGLYGVMSYNVARRTKEIGVRIALGGIPRLMFGRVVAETVTVSAIGIAVGLAAALVSTRVLSAFLFGLDARDPLTLAGSAGVLLVITLVAAAVPARRAATVDPIDALRAE